MFGSTPLSVALETVAVLGRFDPVALAARVTVVDDTGHLVVIDQPDAVTRTLAG
jgi:pimeloyl-ACP methyl ester carboxylesterase